MGSDTAIVSNVDIGEEAVEEVRRKKKTKRRRKDKEREKETTRAKLSGGEEVEAEVTVHRVQGAPMIRHIHLALALEECKMGCLQFSLNFL